MRKFETVEDVFKFQMEVGRKLKGMILIAYLIALIILPVTLVLGWIKTHNIHPNHIKEDAIILGVLWTVILICFIKTYKIGR